MEASPHIQEYASRLIAMAGAMLFVIYCLSLGLLAMPGRKRRADTALVAAEGVIDAHAGVGN